MTFYPYRYVDRCHHHLSCMLMDSLDCLQPFEILTLILEELGAKSSVLQVFLRSQKALWLHATAHSAQLRGISYLWCAWNAVGPSSVEVPWWGHNFICDKAFLCLPLGFADVLNCNHQVAFTYLCPGLRSNNKTFINVPNLLTSLLCYVLIGPFVISQNFPTQQENKELNILSVNKDDLVMFLIGCWPCCKSCVYFENLRTAWSGFSVLPTW